MIDLKKEFGTKYDDLVKCDFLKDVIEILNNDGLINIDLHDIKAICNGEIVGAISTVIADPNDKLEINRISNKEPNSCIVNVVSSMNLSIHDVDIIINNVKRLGSDLSIIYGTTIDDKYDGKFKVQALFAYSDSIAKAEKPEEIVKEEKTYPSYSDEKELLYNIALFVIEEGPSLNGIQNQFGLGFNRAMNMMMKLENLGIVSQKSGTKPRTILINDKNVIKNKIFMI